MKLLRTGSSDFWQAEVMTEDGSKKLLNTFCSTKTEALAVVERSKLVELETASKAHRLTAEVVTLITANRTVTVEQAMEEWDAWMVTSCRSDRTRVNNQTDIRRWIQDMKLAGKTIGSITTDDIRLWINSVDSKNKLGTRKQKLASVRNFMTFCNIKRYILSDPSQLVRIDYKLLPFIQKETKHKKVFADDEIEFLLGVCANQDPPSVSRGFLRAAIILGRDLALRLGDICNLEWPCFQGDTLAIWQGKTNTRLEIPVSKRVKDLVESLPREDVRFLFPKERAIINDTKRRANLSVAFKVFLDRFGFNGYSFHCLRATLATTMANNGATLTDIAERLGHHKGSEATKAYVRKDGASMVNQR
jgi:integrase